MKDRQDKHQWDDADEADFIKGTLPILLHGTFPFSDLPYPHSARKRTRQGRPLPGGQDQRAHPEDHDV